MGQMVIRDLLDIQDHLEQDSQDLEVTVDTQDQKVLQDQLVTLVVRELVLQVVQATQVVKGLQEV